MATLSPPMLAAIEVMGATVVTTRVWPLPDSAASAPQDAMSSVGTTTRATRVIQYTVATLRQHLCSCNLVAIGMHWPVGGGVGTVNTPMRPRPGGNWT